MTSFYRRHFTTSRGSNVDYFHDVIFVKIMKRIYPEQFQCGSFWQISWFEKKELKLFCNMHNNISIDGQVNGIKAWY